jgi:uncharacterized membrane protein YuzA (DUF378 family)
VKNLDRLALIIVLIGALNWGLVGLFDFDAVAWAFGEESPVSRVIYILVALAALYEILGYRAIHRRWALRHPA